MPRNAITALAPVDCRRALQSLRQPARARALLLVVHPHAASLQSAGQGFVRDVLFANGLGTLTLCQGASAEQAAGQSPCGVRQSRQRIYDMFDCVTRQPELAGLPIALIGLGDAAPGCAAAAARAGIAGLKTLVLLDARIDKIAHHLPHLRLPTLFVMGQGDTAQLAHGLAVTRDMPGSHSIRALQQVTLPHAAPGALEAFACTVLNWLEQNLPHAPPLPRPSGCAGARDALG